MIFFLINIYIYTKKTRADSFSSMKVLFIDEIFILLEINELHTSITVISYKGKAKAPHVSKFTCQEA